MGLETIFLMLGLMAQPPAPAPEPAGFCARLAPGLGLGLSLRKDPKGDFWQVNTLNPAQRLLIGGSTMMSFGAAPIGAYTEQETRRAAKTCGVEKKSLACDIVGPIGITATAGGEPVKAEARPGERARLWTSGTRVRCQDLPAG